MHKYIHIEIQKSEKKNIFSSCRQVGEIKSSFILVIKSYAKDFAFFSGTGKRK